MNATKRLLLALVLGVLGSSCASDDASDAREGADISDVVATDAPETGDAADVTASGSCTAALLAWPDEMAAIAGAHDGCFTAADCGWLLFDLECANGSMIGSCGVPVAKDGADDATTELQTAGAKVCEQLPAGCMSLASCACVAPVQCEDSLFRLACLDHRCAVVDTVSFDDLAFVPTERPTVGAFDDVAAFVPDWCASETEGPSPTYGWPTLDCPGLATTWPCSAFLAPLPFTAALTPTRPLLRRQVIEPLADTHPPECACTGGIRTFEWSGLGWGTEGPHRTCQSLVALEAGAPVAIDSPEALALAFAPVETAAEALAFATVTGVGAPSRGALVHLFARTDLQALAPSFDDAEPWCYDRPLQGTRVEAVAGGFRVITFSPAGGCYVDFLDQVTLLVTTAGEVTLEKSEPICWYDDIPCVE